VTAGRSIGSALVRLRPTGGRKLAIEGVEADDPAIVATWAAGPDDGATIKVRVDASRLAGDDRPRNVRVRLADPRGESILVPVVVERE
jgi:hypothetical protein